MKTALRKEITFIILLAFLSAFYFRGIKFLPFHPDESTQIFMSADFLQFFTDYREMIWTPERSGDLRMRYRLLDAPLTRDLIGLGLFFAGRHTLHTDWDWSKSWEENRESGALPDDELLFLVRITLASLFPLTLTFIYFSTKSILGGLGALLTVLLSSTNALLLLHTRRAMAEPALVFGIVFFLWAVTRDKTRPWLVGCALALAVNSKQSALPLLLAGLVAVILPAIQIPLRPSKKILRAGWNVSQLAAIVLFLTLVFNPAFWGHPVQASQEAMAMRQDLLERQVSDRARLAPDEVLNNLGEKAAVLLANLYLTPPSFAEVGNYVEETRSSVEAYLPVPGHALNRSLVGGGILIGLTLLGFIWGGFSFRLLESDRRRKLVLLALATLSQYFGLLALPLPWQRYVIPLVPFSCIWAAAGLNWGLVLIRMRFAHPIGSSADQRILSH